MRRKCPNKKRVMLTQDGYVSASDDDQADPTTEESEEVESVDVYPGDVTPNCTNLMVQRVTADRIRRTRAALEYISDPMHSQGYRLQADY